MNTKLVSAKVETVVEDAPILSLLMQQVSFTWLWLSLRVLLGLTFLDMASQEVIPNGLKGIGISLRAQPPAAEYHVYRHIPQELQTFNTSFDIDQFLIGSQFVLGICLIFGLFAGVFSLYGLLFSGKFMALTFLTSDMALLTVSFLLIITWKLAMFFITVLHVVAEKKKNSPKALPRLTIG